MVVLYLIQLPTFCKMAGVDSLDSGPGKFPVDGLDVWPIISGENSSTLHKEIVLGYNLSLAARRNSTGAIIVGEHKLIVVGKEGRSQVIEILMVKILLY